MIFFIDIQIFLVCMKISEIWGFDKIDLITIFYPMIVLMIFKFMYIIGYAFYLMRYRILQSNS